MMLEHELSEQHYGFQVRFASKAHSALQSLIQPVQVSPGILHSGHVADGSYALKDRWKEGTYVHGPHIK